MEVTGIAESAFMASSTLTTIEIPKTIETIGDRAFAECEILSTVNIGNINIDTQIKLATMGAYLFEKLEAVKNAHAEIVDHRGIGFMQGLEFSVPVGPIVAKCIESGLILISAGANTIRFIPPLIAGKEHVDKMVEILESCL